MFSFEQRTSYYVDNKKMIKIIGQNFVQEIEETYKITKRPRSQ